MNQASSNTTALPSILKRQQQSVRQVQINLQQTESALQIIASAHHLVGS